MRFIQSSDIHLNMIPDSDMPWGKDRSNDIKNSLLKIVDMASAQSADCLFISGNLFHRQPLTKDLKELDTLFRRIPNTHVIIISGNEDRVLDNSALLSFDFAENVHWLLHDLESLYIDEINAKITGLSCSLQEFGEKISELKKSEKTSSNKLQDPLRILLYHDTTKHKDYDSADLPASLPFDYICLGGFHQAFESEDNAIPTVASGSPEPLSTEDTGEHGVYIGDLSPVTHRVQRLEFVPISQLSYIDLNANVYPGTEEDELLQLLKDSMDRLGQEHIYSIYLHGQCNQDLVPGISQGLREYRIAAIYDQTEGSYDFEELYREHPTDLIGYYIREFLKRDFKEDDLSETERKALEYGVQALLDTEEEHSS